MAYAPLRREAWGMYAELRKINPKQAKKFRSTILREREPEKSYDYYDGKPIIWKPFRKYDESYNSYDCKTEIATIMHRMTEEDIREFREYFWVYFVDPYCDGRDCTGAPFTRWMEFLRCKDRTIIIHKIDYDV